MAPRTQCRHWGRCWDRALQKRADAKPKAVLSQVAGVVALSTGLPQMTPWAQGSWTGHHLTLVLRPPLGWGGEGHQESSPGHSRGLWTPPGQASPRSSVVSLLCPGSVRHTQKAGRPTDGR